MYREYGRWFSPSLGRDMEFLWFGKFGRPVMIFPTSGGRFHENEDFHLTASLADKVDRPRLNLPRLVSARHRNLGLGFRGLRVTSWSGSLFGQSDLLPE